MNKLLFIGNFLSKSRGSKSVSEFVVSELRTEGLLINTASHFENRLLRFLHIFSAVAFSRYTLLHIDVFSGKSFLFARLAAMVGKLKCKKIILTLHGGALHQFYNGREKSFESLFRGVVVRSPSMFLKDYFHRKGFNIIHVPNPVMLDKFPMKREVANPYSLLWVRAFTRIYNPEIPVTTLHLLVQEFPKASLTLIGPDRGMLSEIKVLINRLGLQDRVNILGSVKNNELPFYYHSHAVYLNTTSYESFGIAVVEAASCGIPVVSYNVGEIPFIWRDGEDILLSEPEEGSEGIVKQVKRLWQDPELVNWITRNASTKSKEFSWIELKRHWMDLIDG